MTSWSLYSVCLRPGDSTCALELPHTLEPINPRGLYEPFRMAAHHVLGCTCHDLTVLAVHGTKP